RVVRARHHFAILLLPAAARKDVLAIRTESDTPDHVAVAAEAAQLFARADVPQAHRAVPGAGDRGPAIAAEGDAMDLIGVAGETPDEHARLDIPQADALVAAAGKQMLAVGCELRGMDAA